MKRVTVALLSFFSLITFLGVGSVFAAPNAYIDPNTGGLLFQVLAVLFTMLSGFIFFFSSRIKMGFARVMRRVRERRGIETPPETPPENKIA